MLEAYLRERLRKKDILIMTHMVLGYPSFDDCFRIVETMVGAGVDLMELQIPFSEPIADGPVILKANQAALKRGVKVQECLDFAGEITRAFEIPFLFMSYYNILFRYGVDRFAQAMAQRNLRGAIIPDLPPEEGKDYLRVMKRHRLAPIFILSPTTGSDRMRHIASLAEGFLYCVSRKGVTGSETRFSWELAQYLARCRRATSVPLALGFGVKDKGDIDFLKGKADIAVLGTSLLRIIEKEGISSAGQFIRHLA